MRKLRGICAAFIAAATVLTSASGIAINCNIAIADTTKDAKAKVDNITIDTTYSNLAKNARILTISDIHYMSPELNPTGEAFQKYLAGDRKLLAESDAIFKRMLELIKASNANIILASGDLTKDGEEIDHKAVAAAFQKLVDMGKKVYVIDGNHDIYNVDAVKYSGKTTTPVENVSPSEFKEIYKNCGYSQAIAKDPKSLSYVVEPVKGLRIIAIDSCNYDNNIKLKTPVTEDGLTQDRLNWVKQQIDIARKNNCVVFGMMHHGIVPHFSFQQTFFHEYIVKNCKSVEETLADAGMEVVFTGHFHEQDISKTVTSQNKPLFDVETGSLVTYPTPYRLVNFRADGKLNITTKYIDKISYNLGGKTFTQYSKDFLSTGLKNQVHLLIGGALQKMGLKPDQVTKKVKELSTYQPTLKSSMLDLLAEAMVNNYGGDEKLTPQMTAAVNYLKSTKDPMNILFATIFTSVGQDPAPADSNLVIDLKTGEAK